MLEQGASVFLVAHSEYRGVYMGVARRLKDEFGAKVHLYTASKQEKDYYQRKFGSLFASITVANQLYELCRQPVEDEAGVISAARRNEEEFGVTINELSVSDRHLGRGFSLGGYKHPRSHISEKTSYVQMLNAYNEVIAFWRREFDEKTPSLLLNAGKILCVMGRARGLPARVLAESRYSTLYYWAINEYLENPDIEEAFKTADPPPGLGLKAPYDSHLSFRAQFRKEASFFRAMSVILYMLAEQVYWRIRGYEKARGYFLRENIAYIWRRYRDINKLTRSGQAAISDFGEGSFAFFPLATEPETALQMISPEYPYQLSAIASLARDLPAGAMLAVKEHYAAVGRRPSDYYGQISEFKNVRMMNMAELGFAAAKASGVVVTISGTSGFEGAVMGRPVITFGRHNRYNFLPHVMLVTDEAQIKTYLHNAFSGAFDAPKAKGDGRKFLQAIIDCSFDLEDFSPTHPDYAGEAPLDRAFESLKRGLAETPARAPVVSPAG